MVVKLVNLDLMYISEFTQFMERNECKTEIRDITCDIEFSKSWVQVQITTTNTDMLSLVITDKRSMDYAEFNPVLINIPIEAVEKVEVF